MQKEKIKEAEICFDKLNHDRINLGGNYWLFSRASLKVGNWENYLIELNEDYNITQIGFLKYKRL